VDLIQWLQSFQSPLMDSIWGAITQTGSEEFFIFLLPLVFWCIDDRRGWLLLNLVIASVVSNGLLKELFATSRPDPSVVRVLMPETGPGHAFPSGHTQNATTTWGYLASQLKSMRWWALAGVMVLLVGASRLYLGLHWPQDILGGLLFGAIIVALGNWATPRVTQGDVIEMRPLLWWASVALPIAVFSVAPSDTTSLGMGVICGLNLGYGILLPRFADGFPVRVAPPKQVAKMAIGLSGLLLIRGLLKALLPDPQVFRFIRYAIMGLWSGLAAPLIFRALFSER
jgi:membrane-associated phospholipid phosphatase